MTKPDIKSGLGLKLEKPKKEDARYELVFGVAAEEPINWRPWLPPRERQWSLPFCVTYSRLNCAETVANKSGLELNLSDRYLGVISKTTKTGNSLSAVSEAFRKKGVVKEEECPMRQEWLLNPDRYWGTIFSLKDVREDARRYFGGNHSWIADGIKNKLPYIRAALAYSPVQLGVGVGETWENDIVKPPKTIKGYHAVTCYFVNDYIYIQDSIGREFKKLTLDYPIMCAKSFRDLPDNWKEIQQDNMRVDRNLLIRLYHLIFHRKPDAGAESHIGAELTDVLNAIEKSGEWKFWHAIISFFKGIKSGFIKFGKKVAGKK